MSILKKGVTGLPPFLKMTVWLHYYLRFCTDRLNRWCAWCRWWKHDEIPCGSTAFISFNHAHHWFRLSFNALPCLTAEGKSNHGKKCIFKTLSWHIQLLFMILHKSRNKFWGIARKQVVSEEIRNITRFAGK